MTQEEDDDLEQRRVEEANRKTRERFDKDKRCCGCEGHAMEQRENRWWCFTCNAWQKGCGR